MKKVLVTVPFTDEQKNRLCSIKPESFSFRFVTAAGVQPTDVADVNVILGHVPPEVLPYAKNLEWLQLSSAGADRYFKTDVLPDDVILTNAVGAYGLAVSEHMTAFTFSLFRRFPQYSRNQFDHKWKIMGDVRSVHGSTILVLGMGNIGSMYASQVKALGAYVIGVRRTDKQKPDCFDEQYTIDQLDSVLPRADLVAMVVPGGDSTRSIMDKRRFDLMKDGSFLLNVGRGTSVDTDALINALRSGKLAGAALDVTDPEPLNPESPLWNMDNVIITPHASGNYLLAGTLDRVVNILTENFKNYAYDNPLKNIVDRSFGY